LKPTHKLFGYFSALVEQYSKLLNPSAAYIAKLESFATDRSKVLEKANARL